MLTLSSGNKYYSEKEYEDLLRRNRMLLDDIKTISNALYKEAEERSWCADYNEFVEKLNNELYIAELQPLNRTYEVEVRVERKQYATVTIEVEASDSDGAEEYIHTLSFNEILEQCQEGEYNIDWEETDEEYEIEYTREA